MKTHKILVVDDDPNIVELLMVNLKAAGYEVETADNGMRALDMAASAKPDLIILDLLIPAGSGFLIIDKLKTTPETAAIPIVTMSGFSAESLKKKISYNESKTGGANVVFFAPKPLDMANLILKINVFFEGQNSKV